MYKFGLSQQGTPIRAATTNKPPAPIVTVTGATYTGATLSWSGSTGKYEIVGMTGNTFTNAPPFLFLASKLTKTVAFVKLPQGGTYTAVVAASVDGKNMTDSAPVTIFVPYKPPTAPVIKTTTIGYSGVTLGWSASVSNTPLVYSIRKDGDYVKQNISALTEFIPLTAGAGYSISLRADISGTEIVSDLTMRTVFIPSPAKPSVPVLTASSIAFTSTKLSWTAQTVVQAIKNSVTYDIVGTGVTYASGLTVLSTSVRIPAGTNSIKVVARAGITFAESLPITVTVPLQKPTVPVLTRSVVGSTGGQISWTAATGNSPITYSVVSALGGTTYATGLTGTSTVIANSSFTSYGSYPIQVVATAGTTYSVSAGATLRVTLAPPDDIMVNYLSTQGCELSWAPPVINTGVSYSISELAGATFSLVQGPTFDSASGLWLAGVSFGSAQVYDFFISGSAPGFTGPTSEIVVYVPPATQPSSILYRTPGTYTVTIPRGFSGFQAQLVGHGGPGGGNEGTDGYVYSGGGGGGGAGGFVEGSILGTAGTTFALVIGGEGADTIISNLIARSGSAGASSDQGSPGNGGGGGTSSGGRIRIAGDSGRRGADGGYSIRDGAGGGGGKGNSPVGSNYGDGATGTAHYDTVSPLPKSGCALITFFP